MKLDKQVSGTADDRPATVSIPQAVPLLSPMRIASMSEKELQDVLPQLVATLKQGLVTRRPDWWPHATIPWTSHHLHRAVKNTNATCLRSLVSQCYSYLTQHSLKSSPAAPRVPTQPRVLDWLNSNPPSRSCTQPVKTNGIPSTKQEDGLPYLDLHLCCHCNQEFSTRDILQKHQVHCDGGTLPLSIPSTSPASDAPSPTPPTIASDDTASSGGTLSHTAQSLPRSTISYRKFVAALDLVPVHRAKKIRQARRRNTECETIDLEEPKTPISPPTPRTPKLLISLLSRDCGSSGAGGSGSQGPSSRRRLSYLRQSVDKPEDRPKDATEDTESDGGESVESDAEDADEPKLHKKSLFSIDVTSGLGQRVLRHMTAESHVPVISDSEQFCRTPIKDKYHDRLRTRQLNYPVTWKLTGKRLRQQTHYHLYNFTCAQKFEFREKMRTGLNWKCRKLLRCIRKCSVVVKRLSMKTLCKWKPSLNKISVTLRELSEEEILSWTYPKLMRMQPSVLISCPTFVFSEVGGCLGLKRHNGTAGVTGQVVLSPCRPGPGKGPHQHQKWTVYHSVPHSRSSGKGLHKFKGASKQGVTYAVGKTFSTLSLSPDNPASFKVPSESGDGNRMLSDAEGPLKIEIPSMSGQLSAPTKSTRSSPLDDSFSVMTVSSSDDDHNKSTTCCALCALRNKCHCAPETLLSAAASCSHSSASTSRAGSLVPPDLTSPSTLPMVSVSSSLPSVSPPYLSPVSQGFNVCPQSPASSWTSSSKSSYGSPKDSPLAHLKSSANLTESPLAQCDRSKYPGTQSVGKLSGPWKSKDKALGQNGFLYKVSKDQTRSEKAGQRPKTRSNSKESVFSEGTDSMKKSTSFQSGSKGRKEKGTQQGTKLALRAGLRRTRSSSQASGTHSMVTVSHQSSRNVHISSSISSRQERRGKGSREHRDHSKFDRTGQGREKNSSDMSLKRVNADSVSWTLCNGSAGCRTPPQVNRVVNSAVFSGNTDHTYSNFAANSASVQKSSCEGIWSNMNGMMENSIELVHPSDRNSATEAASPPQCGSSIHSHGFSPSSPTSANPFLLSKAQTPLFSSSVLEQARRHWTPEKPLSREGGSVRSGSASPLGSVVLSPDKINGPKSARTGTTVMPIHSCQLSDSPNKGNHFDLSQYSLHQTVSPCQRKRLSAMQMLSVLESAKCMSPARMRALKGSGGKNRKKKGSGGSVSVSAKKSAYHTRGHETVLHASPGKKARLAD